MNAAFCQAGQQKSDTFRMAAEELGGARSLRGCKAPVAKAFHQCVRKVHRDGRGREQRDFYRGAWAIENSKTA